MPFLFFPQCARLSKYDSREINFDMNHIAYLKERLPFPWNANKQTKK